MKLIFKEHKNIFIFFLLAAFIIYGNSLRNKYAIDDDYITVTNFPIKGKQYTPNHELVAKGIKGIPKIWKSRYAKDNESTFDYRPVTTTTFALEYAVFGQNPFISHFLNILLYALSCWLIFCVLLKLFERYDYNFTVACLVSFLFLIHPIHTEVVDNIKCRDELLAFLFPMISLWFSFRFFEKPNYKSALLILLFLSLGILSKKSAMTFIAIIPLCILFFKEIKVRQGVYFGVIISILILLNTIIKSALLSDKSVRHFYHFENPLFIEHLSFFGKIIVALKSLGFYVKFLVFPYPFRFYYGGNIIDVTMSLDANFIIGILFLIALSVYYFKTRNKLFLFSSLLFLGAIFPFVNFHTPVAGIVGERLAFQSSFGFLLMVITVILPYLPKLNAFKLNLLTAKPFKYALPIIIICVIYIWNRNTQWYNKLSLFEHDILYTEESAKANSMLANDYFERLNGTTVEKKYTPAILTEKAITHYKKAVANDSTFYTAYNNVGVVYYNYVNDLTSAKFFFTLAIKHKEKYEQAYENLGNCYKKEGNIPLAFLNYKKAIESNNKHYSGYTSLIGLLLDHKMYENSAKISTIALTLFPNDY